MNRRPFRIALTLLGVVAAQAAFAQAGGGPGGGRGGPGGGSGSDEPGAYASPSGIPQDPRSSDLGIPPVIGLRQLEPIPLPERPDSSFGPRLSLPSIPAFAQPPKPNLDLVRPSKSLILRATLGKDGPNIPSDLVWRLFSPLPAPDGKLPVIAMAKGGEAVFDVPAGNYLLHVGFGRAGMTKRIAFSGEQTHETVAIEAGGLRLRASASDTGEIVSDKLSFDVYSEATEERDRQLIASDVPPDVVLRLNTGNYHVVSRYGAVNAVVRSDVRVDSGKITDATLRHHAAQLTMKLVREHGGEALADTAWSISSEQGDMIRESVGAFASMVLAEGTYVIVARNKDRIFQREFTVKSGEDDDVEVLTSDLIDPNNPEIGTGD